MLRFISFGTKEKISFRSSLALSMGGVDWETGCVTLYAPRLPPLRIPHDNPKVIEALAGILVAFLLDPKAVTGFPGVLDYGFNVNICIQSLEQAMEKTDDLIQAVESVRTAPEDNSEPVQGDLFSEDTDTESPDEPVPDTPLV